MKTFLKGVRIYLREYCSSTSVHGLRYFAEKRTIFEKIWWSIVVIMSFGACVASIYTVYKKWDQSPVIVSFANKETPLYEIPFPAITVCPEAKSQRRKFNYTDTILRKERGNLTDTERTQLDYMSVICIDGWTKASNTSTFSDKFYDFLHKVKPKFVILDCVYGGKNLDCDKIFKPIFTEEGACHTFNMLDRSEMFKEHVMHYRDYHQFFRYSKNWSMEKGYSDDADLLSYPRRALHSGAENGLSFRIVTDENDLDYLCSQDIPQGYKVLVHAPTSFPTPSQEYFMVPLDQNVVAAVRPSMISTSESVRAYSKDRRRCYFQTEKYLEYFKIYNSVNCDIECLTNYTLDMCDCVNFFMPRDNNTKICGSGKVDCMYDAERKLQLKNLKNKIKKNESVRMKKSQAHCDCLPVCTDLSYDVETSQTDWNWRQWLIAIGDQPEPHLHLSALTVYFKSDDFITSVRHEFYGPIDFLANFGGLLGLFTGISVLSIMEMLYFMSIRIVCNNWLYGQWTSKNS